MFKRSLRLPQPETQTFFLWGPRQTGKTTLLQATYPDAFWVDLLKADVFRRYLNHPELLRGELAARGSVRQVVIDEVQKVPQLLDEAHWLHENRKVRFALCGSSARKVKRGQANLLGGRAVRYELHGLTARESELNTQPGCTSVNASPRRLPDTTHHSRPRRLARSYLVRLFHSLPSSGFIADAP